MIQKFYKAKKSLGQNFLKSLPAIKKIITAADLKITDSVLEIGPGKGILTEKILETGATVTAIEKDRELYELLKEKFAKEIESKKLILENSDILDFTPVGVYKIVANIPYNITGAILRKFLTAEQQPQSMVLLVQKEVAERIVARDKKESILSVSVKAYGEPKIIAKVEKRYFSPAPKVDSAIISIKNITRDFFEKNSINEEKFWEIVKSGFAHKRKMVKSNLKKLNLPNATELGNKRAENLTLADWVVLAK